MFFRRSLAALMVLVSMLVAPSAMAESQFTLGRTLLLGMGDSGAEIPLIVCRPTKSLKIKAEREVHLERIVVTYGNDKSKSIKLNRTLKEGDESQWYSLGSRVCVKKLELFGNAEGSKAGIKIFGRK